MIIEPSLPYVGKISKPGGNMTHASEEGSGQPSRVFHIIFSEAPNENIVQNHLNMALLNLF